DALVPDGWLVLGPSDPAPQHAGPFRPEFLPDAVLWRRGAAKASAARPASRTRKPSLAPQRLVRPPASIARPDSAPHPEPPTEALEQVRALVRAGAVPAACERAQQLAQARPLDVQMHLLLGMLQL